jgi:hypothetical protein
MPNVILYPRLERTPELERQAASLAELSIEDCYGKRGVSHPRSVYGSTGGLRATEPHLREIASGLTEIAEKFGYPTSRKKDVASIDAQWGEWLHRNMLLSPHEASYDSLWHFVTVTLVPDLVVWRWRSRSGSAGMDHWVTVKHRGRNTFGRLWWRAEVLLLPDDANPYRLVHELGEDDHVQIMERPSLAGNCQLSRTTACEFIRLRQEKPAKRRNDLLREYQKRMLRLGAYTDFQSLDAGSTAALVKEVFTLTMEAAGAES